MQETTYTLVSGIELHEAKPDRFFVPSEAVKQKIQPGDAVRLVFDYPDPETPQETMWVYVDEVDFPTFSGKLMEWSLFRKDLASGIEVKFDADHIVFVKKAK